MKPHGRIAAVAGACVLVLAACGSSGGTATPTPSGPSGALGIVTVDAARAAAKGLCDMAAEATNREAVTAIFYDTSHEELHVIAAATEVVDRASAAQLLQAKEKVEADLRADPLPGSFPADLEGLIGATRAALKALGIDAPACAS